MPGGNAARRLPHDRRRAPRRRHGDRGRPRCQRRAASRISKRAPMSLCAARGSPRFSSCCRGSTPGSAPRAKNSRTVCSGSPSLRAGRVAAINGARVLPVGQYDGFAAWDLVDIERYRSMWLKAHGFFSLNMAGSRGCSFRCAWCAKPTWGNHYLQRSARDVASEMLYLKRNFAPRAHLVRRRHLRIQGRVGARVCSGHPSRRRRDPLHHSNPRRSGERAHGPGARARPAVARRGWARRAEASACSTT